MLPSVSVAFFVAFVASLVLTPVICALARHLELVDRPSELKLHGMATPLGGGVAVFMASIIALVVVAVLPSEAGGAMRASGAELFGMAVAAMLIVALGLADDRHKLRGRQKLAGQLIVVAMLIVTGTQIRQVEVFGLNVQLGLLALPFTAFWLLGAINAINLLDGADGFASTIGIVISATLATMATWQGHVVEAMTAFALTGALVGFLFFNFPPAKIFLGDAGSMLIGLVIGVLAIRTSLKGPATVALAAPLAVLTIPILDSAVAVLRRWLTGRSLYMGDRGHLHHSLQCSGFGPRGLLAGISLLCTVTAVGALGSMAMRNELYAWASAAAVVGALVVTKVFGFTELTLVTQRALGFGNSLVSSTIHSNDGISQEAFRLQGSRDWDELWSVLTDFAELHGHSRVRLDLNVAWLHEGYFARWQRRNGEEEEAVWLTRLPLYSGGKLLGQLEVAWPATSGGHNLLALLAELLESLQPCVDRLAAEFPPDYLPASGSTPSPANNALAQASSAAIEQSVSLERVEK